MLWGANAVNGVINVITRKSAQTAGLLVDARAGASRSAFGLRFGQSGERLSWRAGLRLLNEAAGSNTPGGGSANDPYRRLGGSVRFDWTPTVRDTVTLSGEVFGGRIGLLDRPHESTSGRNATLRWERKADNGDAFQVQGFYDRIDRDDRSSGGGHFFTDTFDLDVHHALHAGSRNLLVWGAGYRQTRFHIDGTASLFFVPQSRTLSLANVFLEDSLTITPRLTARAGIKLEKDPFLPAALLPEIRLGWKPVPQALVWGSISRAIRSATPFDHDVEERAGIVSLSGNRAFRSEKLVAYELGARVQPTRTLSFSVTGFVHNYTDLRTVEVVPGPGLSLSWGNNLAGPVRGLDAWFDWRAASWWTLSGGSTLLMSRLHFVPGASGIIGPGQAGTDPGQQFKLNSSMNLPASFQVDLTLRAVAALPGTQVVGYREVDGRLALPLGRRATIAVTGTNLLHERHLEYQGGDFIPRRIMAAIELAL